MKTDSWKHLVGESAKKVIDVFMYADLVAAVIVFAFSAIIVPLKAKGMYEGEVMSQGYGSKVRLN